jgi:hypothetical protein
MGTHAVVSVQKEVINIIVWDAESGWTPPPDCTVIEIPDGFTAGIGWTYIDGQFIPPA